MHVLVQDDLELACRSSREFPQVPSLQSLNGVPKCLVRQCIHGQIFSCEYLHVFRGSICVLFERSNSRKCECESHFVLMLTFSEKETNTSISENTLHHWETFFVISSHDFQDVSFPLVSKDVPRDFLRDLLVVELTADSHICKGRKTVTDFFF